MVCTTVLDMHSMTLQELVKTREDLELAEQERDTVQQILTHSSMMYANSDEELESLKEFCHQSNKNVQTLVNKVHALVMHRLKLYIFTKVLRLMV